MRTTEVEFAATDGRVLHGVEFVPEEGPVVGAILLGSTQQLLTVTISSEVNLLVLGVMLVMFVVAAPEGIVGLVRRARRNRTEGEG